MASDFPECTSPRISDSFLHELQQSLGPQIPEQLASQFGRQQDQASAALEKVAPLILGGLKRQAEQGGEDRVNHIVQKYGRETVRSMISAVTFRMVPERAVLTPPWAVC
ncbi:MAG: DUF937 domain-containing protein [Verrucomicrobiales bacterium]